MTEKEAIKRVLNVNNHARIAVERILLWDESKTMQDNARKLNISAPMASRLVGEYHLKFKHRRAEWVGKHPKTLAYLDLRKAGWTLQDIADVFKVTHQAISLCLKTRANDPAYDMRGRPKGAKNKKKSLS